MNTGTFRRWDQISRNATDEAIQRYGTALRRRKDRSRPRIALRYSQVVRSQSPVVILLTLSFTSYQPAPFFVLDEVDAALDNTNVAKIAMYIRSRASGEFQFIVISLKNSLYERGHSLVGIYRDQEVNSSSSLTLDVSALLPVRTIKLIGNFCSAHAIRRLKRCNLSYIAARSIYLSTLSCRNHECNNNM